MKHMALKKNLDVTIHEAFLEEILQGNWKPGQALNLDDLAERRLAKTDPAMFLKLHPAPVLIDQPDPHPAGPEADAYPGHGGFFQQGTLLRAHLQ